MTSFDNILQRLQSNELILPIFENQMMADKWPDSYTITIDSSEYYGRPGGVPDGYFHPSTHALMGARELYYRFHPDTRDQIIQRPNSLQRQMTLSMGKSMHGVVQTMMKMTGLVTDENIEVEYVNEQHHLRGRIDFIVDHPTEGPVPVEMKAVACSTPIMTTNGWCTMGELQDGDEVYAPDGQFTKVLKAHPVLLGRPCYEVKFRDGQSIVVDEDHLWAVRDTHRGGRGKDRSLMDRVMRTKDIVDAGVRVTSQGNGSYRFAVPVTEALQHSDIELPIDPWLLGMWLGDGGSKSSVIACGKGDLPYLCERLDALGYEYQTGCYAPRPSVFSVYVYGLRSLLIALGLLGNKHIPERYLMASEEQRRQLLAGLMDSDGTIGVHQVSICMVRESLMRKVLQLVRSLGYRATWKTVVNTRARGGVVHFVKFSSRWGQSPFDMPRKRDKFEEQVAIGSRMNLRLNSIVAIKEVDTVPVRCITVAHELSLYLVGEGFVPTHNTRNGYQFDKTDKILPSWDAQLSLGLDNVGADFGILLMAQTAFPFMLREFRVPKNAVLVEEIYQKFDLVREAIANDTPPRHCCAEGSQEMNNCPARYVCWLAPESSVRTVELKG